MWGKIERYNVQNINYERENEYARTAKRYIAIGKEYVAIN